MSTTKVKPRDLQWRYDALKKRYDNHVKNATELYEVLQDKYDALAVEHTDLQQRYDALVKADERTSRILMVGGVNWQAVRKAKGL